MARLLRAFSLLIGLLVLVAGAAGAAYVGPDDRVWLQDNVVASQPGEVVVTSPTLTSYRDLHLLVRASAPGGVFLGAGNPIDVSDLAAQVDHYEVTGIRRTHLLGRQRAASAADPIELPDPASLRDWHDHRVGDGVQQLDLDLDGTPTQLLVQPLAKDSPTLAFGIELKGLFWTLVGVGVLGALIVGLALWRMRRAKHRGPGGADSTAGLTGPPTGSPGHEAVKVGTALSVVAVLATGCGWMPEPVDPPVDQPAATKVALADDDVAPMLAEFDTRMNKAIKAADGPRYDAVTWRDVDAGPVYDADQYSTRLRAAIGKTDPTPPVKRELLESLSPTFTSYPMWTVAVSKTTGGDEAYGVRSKKEKKEYAKEQAKQQRTEVTVEVFERTSAAAPWMRRIAANVLAKDLPAPAASPSPADSGDLKLANQVMKATLDHSRDQKPAIKVEFSKQASELRQERLRTLREDKELFPAVKIESMDLSDDADGLRMVAVEGGHLAIGIRKIRFTWVVNDDRVRWADNYEGVNGSGFGTIYQERNLAIVALIPDDDSTPKVLAVEQLSDIS